jgi:type IV secretion system protein VirD4
MSWFKPTERERWRSPYPLSPPRTYLGLPALDYRSRDLYERALPRNVLVPRFVPDRPPANYWMSPRDLSRFEYLPGQIILGKLGSRFLGYLDDRPMVTIAGARAGKTSTVLEPNICLYPGSMLLLDPKADLTPVALLRRALGHDVHVLDPFGQSGQASANFNVLSELDPKSWTIIDDVAAITHALIVDESDARSKHWTDSARALLSGIILLTLMLPETERNLISVRELLLLTHPRLIAAMKTKAKPANDGDQGEEYFNKNALGIQTLLGAMSQTGQKYNGILAAIGNRFLSMPQTERGSVFSTAAAQTDFLDSLPLRKISQRSDFCLAALRGNRPTTIVLCLPVGRMQSHYRWLRLIVQISCTVLERLGAYPRNKPPILYLMEEFATLGHMEIMQRAAAYFPSFGIKLWAILQDINQLDIYGRNAETFLGNAGLVQCFANGDQSTLNFITQRLGNLIEPFELRTAFSRQRHSQLLMFEGERPAAAMRLDHEDVAAIRAQIMQQFHSSMRPHP